MKEMITKTNFKNTHTYDDILYLPHHTSTVHPPMSLPNRAAQFSPFAALTGYEDQIRETARLTDSKIELDENAREQLDEALRIIQEQTATFPPAMRPQISVTYFLPDDHKAGGKYITASGFVKKIDLYRKELTLASMDEHLKCPEYTNDLNILFDDILEIEC